MEPMSQDSAARRWCFTLNYTIDNAPGLLTYDSVKMGYLIYSEEIGDAGNVHFQGYVEFRVKKRLTALKKMSEFDGAHWEVAKGTAAENREYCSKSDTHLCGPYEWGEPKRDGVAKPYDEMMKAVRENTFTIGAYAEQYVRHHAGVDKVLNYFRKLRVMEAMDLKIDLRPWQEKICRLLEEKPDGRAIHWFYDTIGNTGKTTFALWLAKNKNAQYFDTTCKADVCYAITDDCGAFVFDVARADAAQVNYATLEMAANGAGFSGKYHSATKYWKKPHVLVFANFPPNESQLSTDRWHVTDLQPTRVSNPIMDVEEGKREDTGAEIRFSRK